MTDKTPLFRATVNVTAALILAVLLAGMVCVAMFAAVLFLGRTG